MTKTQNARSLQLWPRGTSIEVKGEGSDMRVKPRDATRWRKPTDAERKAIRLEELAERIKNEDLYCCDSMLVSDALKLGGEGEIGQEFTYENVSNLRADPSDWGIRKCRDWLKENGTDFPDPNPWAMNTEKLAAALDEFDFPPNETDDELRGRLIDKIDDEEIDGLDAWRDAVEEASYEHEADIYEWWRVSGWLAGKLNEIGECVLDNSYGCWWGRQVTGQQLIMDGTLQRVAELLIS